MSCVCVWLVYGVVGDIMFEMSISQLVWTSVMSGFRKELHIVFLFLIKAEFGFDITLSIIKVFWFTTLMLFFDF